MRKNSVFMLVRAIFAVAIVLAVSAHAADSENDQEKAIRQACPGMAAFSEKKKLETQQKSANRTVVLPELRDRLLAWAKLDQEARAPLMREMNTANTGLLVRRMAAVDKKNYARIRDTIDEYGFPVRSMVGDEASDAAFLLVQHQDEHREFQQLVLDIITPLAKRGEVDGQSFALLTDRLLVAQNKLQRYGTQSRLDDKGIALKIDPVEDPERLDQRRAEIGLPPMADYRCVLGAITHLPVE